MQLSSLVRLESSEKPLNLADVGIGDYFDEFISSHSVYAEENNICIEYSHDCKDESFRIDKSEMNRVFGNLLENTVRHRNDKSSVVKLSVTVGGGKAEIRYSDNGPGVRTEQLDRIFDSFYRGDESRTRPENGSGLGLAVVKSIIVKHGGSVSAYIENGLGILIVLPLAERKDINEKDTDNRG